jgi:hypothetical protein
MSDALMMEAAKTSETLVNFYQTTRHYNPEDSNPGKIIVFTTIFLETVEMIAAKSPVTI